MASSKIEICNMALAHLGVTTTIAALTESSKEARNCNLFFDSVRDTMLESYEWGFAKKHVVLALTTAEITNWEYAYKYPTDCVAARRIVYPGTRNIRASQRIPFEVATDGTQRLILTDQEDAELIYTVRVTDPNLFSPGFVDAMSHALAAKLAMPLAVSASIANAARSAAGEAFDMAVAGDLRQGQDDEPPESEFISIRY